MSNLSIYEKKWLDLVFEGRNQSYGAYRLRIENSKTTLISLLLGTMLFLGGLTAFSLANTAPEATSMPAFNPDVIIKVQHVTQPKKEQPQQAAAPKVEQPKQKNDERQLINPQVVSSTDDLPEIMTNAQAAVAVSHSGEVGTGNSVITSSGSGISTTTDTRDAPAITATLDKLPEFPGGIQKFLNYVGTNFREPDLDNSRLEKGKAVTVIVSFVIEIDGSMTDIKVLRDPGYRLGDEAVRVLKSQKTKWKAGIKNGKSVRTLYTLPISVIPQ